ncbi:hypothetical protein KKC08_01195 [Patescibacteria group bacterium]|nr:hypothetical protein [Patescibacteria group bacterium]MCG2701792.1 hypothetical protein [Candidatus Parcubacteria bacterium]MBU4210507.1 hypothetical protein [Patescibacteria group bacterium]MBU4264696.1 hypothetical protein [Patescibacteria group bacterium]MBU4390651.1 hypothetical protein [Patescibacteria group bacterium]
MGLIPEYFKDKFNGIDEKQVATLSEQARNRLIYGTDSEAGVALADLRARERSQRTRLLGEAGLELIMDMRAMAGMRG